MSADPFSVEAARRAERDGRLGAWVTTFLASPGSDNGALAAELAFSGASYAGPVWLALDEMHPLAGPDEQRVRITVPVAEWDDEVISMDESLERGWEPPPLLVSYRSGEYIVEDGNHRRDALRRAGITHTWAVVAFWDDEDRLEFCSRRAPNPDEGS